MSDDFEIAAVAPINPKWLDDEPGIDWPGHPSDTNALGNLRPTPLSEALAGHRATQDAPKRIQLRRTKGWRKPEGAVVVSRPSKWGNIWKLGDLDPWAPYEPLDHAGVVRVYRYHAEDNYLLRRVAQEELAGRDLCCWCALDKPCHADVLLELANDR